MQSPIDWWYAEQRRPTPSYVIAVLVAAAFGLIVLSVLTGGWDTSPQQGVTVETAVPAR